MNLFEQVLLLVAIVTLGYLLEKHVYKLHDDKDDFDKRGRKPGF